MCAAIECLRFFVEMWNVMEGCNRQEKPSVLKGRQNSISLSLLVFYYQCKFDTSGLFCVLKNLFCSLKISLKNILMQVNYSEWNTELWVNSVNINLSVDYPKIDMKEQLGENPPFDLHRKDSSRKSFFFFFLKMQKIIEKVV